MLARGRTGSSDGRHCKLSERDDEKAGDRDPMESK